MPNPAARLTLLAFPQFWDGLKIGLRVVVLPKGNPREALLPGAPAFAEAQLALQAVLVSGLETMPAPGVETTRVDLALAMPAGRGPLFEELERVFRIKPTPPGQVVRKPGTSILKFLTPSYRRASAFDGPRTRFAVIDDRYKCALTETTTANRPPRPPLSDEVTWGQIVGFALKNPLLAQKLGLIYRDVTVPAAGTFDRGGWLYVTLAAGSSYAAETGVDPALLGRYAARIPALSTERALFAAVLFPVRAAPPGNYDELFIEAESYDDGFAKIVHGAQPRTMGIADLEPTDPLPVKDIGVRLGWDDEQVAIWLNRSISPATQEDTVLGVGGYRVDVRPAGSEDWHSMVSVRGPVQVGEIPLGVFEGELAVQTTPAQLLGQKTGEYWLPSFFAAWAGRSVVIRDRAEFDVSGQSDVITARAMQPVDDDTVPLRYGNDYEFRVRLKDLSGGGPETGRWPRNPAPAPRARVAFRRFAPPKAPSVRWNQTKLLIERPRLGYPDLVFTRFEQPVQALLADTPAALQEKREPGVHDPDVTAVQIAVEVRLPEGDDRLVPGREPFMRLYTAVRQYELDAPLNAPLEVRLAYADVKDVVTLRSADPMRPQPGVGPLTLPTARDVRLLVRALGRPDPELEYFGSEAARVTQTHVPVSLRAAAFEERSLFVSQSAGQQIQAIFMQPEPPRTSQLVVQLAAEGRQHEGPADVAHRLAQQLDLTLTALTFGGAAGRRTVFGCSAALGHTLAPARSSITFASKAELTRRWIIAIRVQLDRDWTWDGVSRQGFEVLRDDGEVAGRIEMPRSVTASALSDAERRTTDLVFFDAFDGKPDAGRHPREMTKQYAVRPVFEEPAPASDPPLTWPLRLPITTPPGQTPKLVAAGIALSPYEASADYSSTAPRERRLWLEFDGPPDDPDDVYVARVLAYGPDPMLLYLHEDVPVPEEPPLPVDPEPIRVITPLESSDRAGMDAMQSLIAGTVRDGREPVRHYLLPLPPGLESTSLGLFGFFVYEIRLGHTASRWSTAQGRYGPPLRVSGVQHPAPPLTCATSRLPDVIIVSAPFATPVLNGRNLRPARPNTDIWVMLYAQVTQVDGASQRNILVSRRVAEPQHPTGDQRYGDPRIDYATARFDVSAIAAILARLRLPADLPLSAMAVEMYRGALDSSDPLGEDLGHVRLLRTSPLVRVPPMCATG